MATLPRCSCIARFRPVDMGQAGRFLVDRDGILHRSPVLVAILHWDGSAMKVKHRASNPFGGRRALSRDLRFVLGRFIRGGPDVGNPDSVLISPDLTGVFAHDRWSSASFGVNHRIKPNGREFHDFGCNWFRPGNLLMSRWVMQRWLDPGRRAHRLTSCNLACPVS